MAEVKTDALISMVETLLSEKQALAKKESELVEVLNSMLNRMGYQVVARKVSPPAGRTARRGRRRGRPRRAAGAAATAAKGPAAKRRRRTARKK